MHVEAAADFCDACHTDSLTWHRSLLYTGVMATTTTKKDVIRFIVDVRPSKYSDHGRLEAVAYPVIIEEDGKIRNCQWSGLGDRGADFADLRVEGWVDRDCSNKEDFYWGLGWHNAVEYREVFSIDERRAASMAKTLPRINNKLDALNKERGYPQDYAQFLSYLAIAMGAKGTAVFGRRVESSGHGWSYDDSEYRWMDINALRCHFQGKLREWRGDD